MKTRFLFVPLVLACPLLMVASPAAADNKKVILSQFAQSAMFVPVYVAVDRGFFEKQGLAVSIQTAGSPTAALAAVISGSADFSLHGPEWTAIAASKGADVQVIAGVVNRAAVWMVAAPSMKYAGTKDLAGQTISTGMMPIASTSLLTKLFRDSKIDPVANGITVKQVQSGSEFGPLMAGQASVSVLYEPAVDLAVSKGFKVIHSFPKQYGPYLLSAITTKKSIDADTAQRFVAGLQGAIDYMRANPTDTVAVAKAGFPSLDPAVVEAAVKRMLDEEVYATSVEISPAALEIAMETQISLGNLKAQPAYDGFVARKLIDGGLARLATGKRAAR